VRIFPCIFPCYLCGEWFARDCVLRHSVWLFLSFCSLWQETSVLRAKWPECNPDQRPRFLRAPRCHANRPTFLCDSERSAFCGGARAVSSIARPSSTPGVRSTQSETALAFATELNLLTFRFLFAYLLFSCFTGAFTCRVLDIGHATTDSVPIARYPTAPHDTGVAMSVRQPKARPEMLC